MFYRKKENGLSCRTSRGKTEVLIWNSGNQETEGDSCRSDHGGGASLGTTGRGSGE
jgi:hypothetical protein